MAPEADDTVLQPSQARPFSQEQEEESQSLLAAYSTTLQDSLPLREEKIKVRIYYKSLLINKAIFLQENTNTILF